MLFFFFLQSEAKKKLMMDAVNSHVSYMKDATQAKGVDRHLFGALFQFDYAYIFPQHPTQDLLKAAAQGALDPTLLTLTTLGAGLRLLASELGFPRPAIFNDPVCTHNPFQPKTRPLQRCRHTSQLLNG